MVTDASAFAGPGVARKKLGEHRGTECSGGDRVGWELGGNGKEMGVPRHTVFAALIITGSGLLDSSDPLCLPGSTRFFDRKLQKPTQKHVGEEKGMTRLRSGS